MAASKPAPRRYGAEASPLRASLPNQDTPEATSTRLAGELPPLEGQLPSPQSSAAGGLLGASGMTVEATPRKAMTKARRLRLYLACNGRCVCGVKVPMAGTVIDHEIPLWMGGADEDANLRFLCRDCDRIKTAGDKGKIAKVKRILARENGTRRERQPIKSAGFNTRLRKKMNGTVEVRS